MILELPHRPPQQHTWDECIAAVARPQPALITIWQLSVLGLEAGAEPGAALSHRLAGQVHGISRFNAPRIADVTTTKRRPAGELHHEGSGGTKKRRRGRLPHPRPPRAPRLGTPVE